MPEQKILIIDDEATTLEIVSKILKNSDFECITAVNGEDGLKKAQEEQPAAILLDQMMPGIGGDDVLQELKNNDATKKIPVIMLTAKNNINDVSKSLELGAEDYMVKPFDKDGLIIRLQKVLG